MPGLFDFAKRTAWEVWGEPILSRLGLYEQEDITYGRTSIPFSPMEKRLHDNSDISVTFGKAYLANGKDYCWYQVWEDKFAQRKTGRKADMIFAHGTGVHSGTLASHSRRYLDAGFRLIVPDLISHGYSSGMHVYRRDINWYTEGLWAVLHDVARKDDEATNNGVRRKKSERRTTFMLGLSFGGLVALLYALHYPHSLREDPEDEYEIPIDGIVGVGPIVEYSRTNVKLPFILQQMVYFGDLWFGVGRLEVIVPHKKCLDKDPKVYKTLVSEDKRSHQGAFRIGHLLCIHFAVEDLQIRAKEIKHPLFIQQGGQDRVACHEAAINFVRDASSTDKRMAIYPVCQHVIYRKAKTEEEDMAGRVACIEDNLNWMMERSPGFGSIHRQTSFQSDITLINEGPLTPALSDASSFQDGLFDGPASTPQTPLTPAFSQSSSSSIDEATIAGGNVPIKVATLSGNDFFANAIAQKPTVSKDSIEHPLLAKAHPTTLPLLARLCPERHMRPGWKLHEALRPYDIAVSHAVGVVRTLKERQPSIIYIATGGLVGNLDRAPGKNMTAKEFYAKHKDTRIGSAGAPMPVPWR